MEKIPDNAKAVFEGVLHTVYQWEQKMFDGSVATFEAIKRRDAATVIATTEGKILLNDEEQPGRAPFVAMPGGMTEDGSTNLENAQRELKEETGYESSDWEEWFTSDVLKSPRIDFNNHFFIARQAHKTTAPHLDPGERIQTSLITFDEFLALRDNPKFRNKDLIPILEAASEDNAKRQELYYLLFGREEIAT